MAIKLLCFRVYKNDFSIHTKLRDLKFEGETNWNTTNSEELSDSLNKQCKINYLNMFYIDYMCEQNDDGIFSLENSTDIDKINEYTFFNTKESREDISQNAKPGITKRDLCNKYKNMRFEYDEVLNRDSDAFKQDNFNVNLYAVILLYNGLYYGHIYTWLFEGNCYCIGIRSRIDNIFINSEDRKLKYISKYLLEGVRRYALIEGCDTFYVINPLNKMKSILSKYGFKYKHFSGYLGNSLNTGIYNYTLYFPENILNKIIDSSNENPIVFIQSD